MLYTLLHYAPSSSFFVFTAIPLLYNIFIINFGMKMVEKNCNGCGCLPVFYVSFCYVCWFSSIQFPVQREGELFKKNEFSDISVSIGPRTKNKLCAIWISKIWFLSLECTCKNLNIWYKYIYSTIFADICLHVYECGRTPVCSHMATICSVALLGSLAQAQETQRLAILIVITVRNFQGCFSLSMKKWY